MIFCRQGQPAHQLPEQFSQVTRPQQHHALTQGQPPTVRSRRHHARIEKRSLPPWRGSPLILAATPSTWVPGNHSPSTACGRHVQPGFESQCPPELRHHRALKVIVCRHTREVLARMQGVRCESVTQAAGRLQAAGLIHCVRGRIEVLDHGALGSRACECHGVVKREHGRLLPQVRAARPAASRRWNWPASEPAALAAA